MLAWTVKFDFGEVIPLLMDTSLPVRCVRGKSSILNVGGGVGGKGLRKAGPLRRRPTDRPGPDHGARVAARGRRHEAKPEGRHRLLRQPVARGPLGLASAQRQRAPQHRAVRRPQQQRRGHRPGVPEPQGRFLLELDPERRSAHALLEHHVQPRGRRRYLGDGPWLRPLRAPPRGAALLIVVRVQRARGLGSDRGPFSGLGAWQPS